VLSVQLQNWLDQVPPRAGIGRVRAIISPHAGYRFSGATAAHSFRQLNLNDPNLRRVFVLGPSHRFRTSKCLLSGAQTLSTPLLQLPVDVDVNRSLLRNGAGMFETMSKAVDEAEHSIEMQLPFLAKLAVQRDPNLPPLTFVPIMVGSISRSQQAKCAQLLHPYFDDHQNAFVISSDFCHWGERFGFTPYDSAKGAIWQSIEAMDRRGMQCIQRKV
jgi:AmmeMemoRadiSam system protein B